MDHYAVLDFETSSACNLKKAGAHKYAEDPTTEILCLGIGWHDGKKEQWIPGEPFPHNLFEAIKLGYILVAHNAAFEKSIWRAILVPLGWPDVPNEQWADTMATCAMKALPLALDKASKVLRLSHAKDMAGNRIMKAFSKLDKKGWFPRDPEKLKIVHAYNLSDIDAQRDLHQTIGFLPKNEQKVWLLDQEINERGLLIDMEFVRAAQSIVDKASKPLLKEFAERTDGLAPTQTAKVGEWLARNDAELPNLQAETIKQALEGELPDEARRILEIRKSLASSSIKKLKAIPECVGENGRVKGTLQYHGATPGRWTGRLIQPQNLPRPTFKIDNDAPDPQLVVDTIMSGDPEWVEDMFGDPIKVVAGALRHMIISEPGHLLLSGDYSTIELRVLMALAGQRDKVDMLKRGVNAYCDMAEKIFRRPINKENDAAEYQIGKGTVLGLGFGMGKDKFNETFAPEHDLMFCEEVVRIYRKEWAPNVPELWRDIESAALFTVKDRTAHETHNIKYQLEGRWLTCRLPSGRKLWYFNPQLVRRAMPWDEMDIRWAWTYQAMKTGQWKTIDAYGGHLTENIVQATARDLLVDSMFKAEKEGLPLVLTVHDEQVSEPPEKEANPKLLAQIMADIPEWARLMDIPVTASCWVGERYRK